MSIFLVSLGWTLKVVLGAWFFYYERAVTGDPAVIPLIFEKIARERAGWLVNLATAVWLYSMFDAWLVARKRRRNRLKGNCVSSLPRDTALSEFKK